MARADQTIALPDGRTVSLRAAREYGDTLYNGVCRSKQQFRDDRLAFGRFLLMARRQIEHGDWSRWLQQCGWNQHTVCNAMRTAREALDDGGRLKLDELGLDPDCSYNQVRRAVGSQTPDKNPNPYGRTDSEEPNRAAVTSVVAWDDEDWIADVEGRQPRSIADRGFSPAATPSSLSSLPPDAPVAQTRAAGALSHARTSPVVSQPARQMTFEEVYAAADRARQLIDQLISRVGVEAHATLAEVERLLAEAIDGTPF